MYLLDISSYIVSVYVVFTVVNGQECTDAVGSLGCGSNIFPFGITYILTEYTIPCSGTVVAWEFCYRVSGTFYPSIWRITGMTGDDTDYELIHSNSVTFSGTNSYQRVNLSTTDQFTAPAGSVVGLYYDINGAQLLQAYTNSSIKTYQFIGNPRSINGTRNDGIVNYTIAIRVHFGKSM